MSRFLSPGGSPIIPSVVPPQVEFPFGRDANTGQLVATASEPTPQTPYLLEHVNSKPKRRPMVNKFLTERPAIPARDSAYRLERRATGSQLLNAANHDSSSSDTESLSSSDGEDPASAAPSAKKNAETAKKTKKSGGAAGPRRDSSAGPYSRFSVGNDDYRTRGRVSRKDGRLNISVQEHDSSGYLAKALGATLKHHLGPTPKDRNQNNLSGQTIAEDEEEGKPSVSRDDSTASTAVAEGPCPKLNIVIMVIGSRGDIQPFLRIGKVLKEEEGHRVRIATHPAFRSFVEDEIGLEFFSVGGDPSELMAFMVKNPGLIPSVSTVKAGEIGRRRDQMFEMFQGFWRACINATDDEKDVENLKMMGDKHPFVADAIIANPPSFAHVHCAEKLGIPLHLMFTMPWSPTRAFPHPLANIKKSNVDPDYTNFMSYPLVEMMTWQGLGDLVNRFRVTTLNLEPVSTLWAPGQLFRLKVPYTYLFSPGLVPKPADWGPEIDVAGFVYLDLADTFQPPASLVKFLDAGPPPVYIGFGSIVVDDPNKFTALVFEAVKKAGVRALVSKGWGGLGDDVVPEHVYMLENTPHDWLFPRVSAVIHHGGAGTTAAGLKAGKPTLIVPFFGDQPFWGDMVAKAGAGYHKSIPYKRLSAEELAIGIDECLKPAAREAAEEIAKRIEKEGDAGRNAVKSFLRHLKLRGPSSIRCSILEDRVAVWYLKSNPDLHLSALAADILVQQRKISWRSLRLLRHQEWNDFDGPGEPFTGGSAAIFSSLANAAIGIGGVPLRWAKRIKRYEKDEQEKNNRSVFVREMKAANPKSSSKDGLVEDLAGDIATGLGNSGRAIAKAPMDLSLAIAQGFHNAPRLYGDDTVRRPVRITGMKSGLRAARSEFVYGIYDGWTGVVTQPVRGAKRSGAGGLAKGVGYGFGGFVLKNISAIVGPWGFAAKGVHREIVKRQRGNPEGYIRKARIIQGGQDIRALQGRQREEVLQAVRRGWKGAAAVQMREQRERKRKRDKRKGLLRRKKLDEEVDRLESKEGGKEEPT